MTAPGQLKRLATRATPPVTIHVDGVPVVARAGDSLLSAILTGRRSLRLHEFDHGPRAGFCAMGACQDCWVWVEGGQRLRACTTEVAEGLRLSTAAGGAGHG